MPATHMAVTRTVDSLAIIGTRDGRHVHRGFDDTEDDCDGCRDDEQEDTGIDLEFPQAIDGFPRSHLFVLQECYCEQHYRANRVEEKSQCPRDERRLECTVAGFERVVHYLDHCDG